MRSLGSSHRSLDMTDVWRHIPLPHGSYPYWTLALMPYYIAVAAV